MKDLIKTEIDRLVRMNEEHEKRIDNKCPFKE